MNGFQNKKSAALKHSIAKVVARERGPTSKRRYERVTEEQPEDRSSSQPDRRTDRRGKTFCLRHVPSFSGERKIRKIKFSTAHHIFLGFFVIIDSSHKLGKLPATALIMISIVLHRRKLGMSLFMVLMGFHFREGFGWTTSSPFAHHHHLLSSKASSDAVLFKSPESDSSSNEPDLFEYFDPLLSPHAYPNGISPDQKPVDPHSVEQEKPQQQSFSSSDSAPPLPIQHVIDNSNPPNQASTAEESTSSDDLFDYFDPLLSPHSYPNGISPQNRPQERPSTVSPNSNTDDSSTSDDEERYNPLQFPKYKENASAMNAAATAQMTRSSSNSGASAPAGSKQRLGILLMDHGSRNPKSNARLQKLAELYQLTLDDDMEASSSSSDKSIVVAAAHMEIASPSIPDGLKVLLDQGVGTLRALKRGDGIICIAFIVFDFHSYPFTMYVTYIIDEIVCHPYFLSPGRHATEDIPQIISEAIASMKIDIPVITTDPVGSNTQLMIGAIHSQVREHSSILQRK